MQLHGDSVREEAAEGCAGDVGCEVGGEDAVAGGRTQKYDVAAGLRVLSTVTALLCLCSAFASIERRIGYAIPSTQLQAATKPILDSDCSQRDGWESEVAGVGSSTEWKSGTASSRDCGIADMNEERTSDAPA